ncbi:MAG TPA: VOC family protein [Trebonia sp.]|nr:VOC family protein [Trebonia sp.]
MSIRWLTVFLDFPAGQFAAGTAFWQAVTGYGLSAGRGADGQFATLLPPAGDACLRVQRLRDGAARCHLDLHVDTAAEPLAAAAGRARAAGARTFAAEEGLILAESPGGFPFCLVKWDHEDAVPPPLTAAGGGVSRADTLCLDVPPGDFERECGFWAAFTGGETHQARVPGFAYLTRPPSPIRPAGQAEPAGKPAWPVRLLLQRRDEAGPGERTRGHVDFGCTDPDAVRRHEDLGARVVARHHFWTVLAGPGGHEYCLIDREPG